MLGCEWVMLYKNSKCLQQSIDTLWVYWRRPGLAAVFLIVAVCVTAVTDPSSFSSLPLREGTELSVNRVLLVELTERKIVTACDVSRFICYCEHANSSASCNYFLFVSSSVLHCLVHLEIPTARSSLLSNFTCARIAGLWMLCLPGTWLNLM